MLTQFFTKGRGITMTSAQTIHNFAKEKREALLTQLKGISFVDEFRDKVGVDCPNKKVKSGISAEKAATIVATAQKIADYDRLCAWLGEAVKAKNALINKVNLLVTDNYDVPAPIAPERMSVQEYAKSKGIEFKRPTKREVSIGDVLAEFSVKELAEYYGSNSESAVYGNLIHKGAPINEARMELHKAIASPYEITTELICSFSPTVLVDDVEHIFTELQGLQRSYNAQHNAFEARIKNRLSELQRDADVEYLKAYNDYTNLKRSLEQDLNREYDLKVLEYEEANEKHIAGFNQWQADQVAEVASLKIAIPEALDPLFTELDKELRG